MGDTRLSPASVRTFGRLARAALLAAACCAQQAEALDPTKPIHHYRLSQWGVDDGLAHGSVHMAREDAAGFLWVGTLVGLTRFDGVRFAHAVSGNESRIDYFARAVAFEKETAWAVLGEGGVAQRVGNRWLAHALPSAGSTRAIAERRAGGYWLGTERGLFELDVTGATPKLRPVDAVAATTVWFIREDPDGTLWLGTESGTYTRAPGATAFRHLEAEWGLPHKVTWCVHRDRDGVYWVGGRNGLIRFDGRSMRRYSQSDGLALATVRGIAEDRHGSLWLATPGGGVQRFRDGRFESLRAQDGLASDSVMTVYVDRADNLWIGMAGGGLARLSDTPFEVMRKRDGLSGDWIWGVHQDKSGDVWVGTNGNGASLVRRGVVVRRIPGDVENIDSVWAIHGWDAGRAIVSTTGGVARIERDNRVTWLKRNTGSQAFPRVFLRLADQRLLMADGGKLLEVRESGLVPTSYPAVEGVITSLIETTREGELVAGTRQGVVLRLSPQGKALPIPGLDNLGAPVMSLTRDDRGRLWGSANGVIIVDGARHVRINHANGYPERNSNQVILGPGGAVWVLSNRGVFRTAQDSALACLANPKCRLRFDVFDERDGLVTAETNGGAQPGHVVDAEGVIWLPSINGLIKITPRARPGGGKLPTIRVDALRADRLLINGARPLVPANARNLEIDYTLPELTLPKLVRFRYRLLPHQPEWVEVGSRRTAYFASLTPGTYQFEVAGARPYEDWGPVTVMHEFEVAATWYQTSAGRAAIAVLLTLLVLAVPVLRYRALTAHKRELEHDVMLRTRELADANKALDKLARTDALTGIANRREFGEQLARTAAGFDGKGWIVVMIADIDDFKAYNDHYGHPAGDACLADIARVVAQAAAARGGLACRYGGEEFAAVIRVADAKEGASFGENVVSAVRQLARPHKASSVVPYVTISVGLYASRFAGELPSALLHHADQALYEAKAKGRNQMVLRVGN